jgi:hypothetical protein
MSDLLSFGASNSLSRFVGLNITSVPVSELKAMGLSVRVLGPKSMATRDYHGNRINLILDSAGNVTSAYLG